MDLQRRADVITYKTPAFIIDDPRVESGKDKKPEESSEDHGDIATPEPSPPTDDDRPLD